MGKVRAIPAQIAHTFEKPSKREDVLEVVVVRYVVLRALPLF